MARSSARNRWIVCSSCLGAVILIAALSLIPLLLTSSERLTRVGRRVADSSRWIQAYDGYYWDTNDSQVVALQEGQGQVVRLDDRSRTVTPFVPLSRLQGIGVVLNRGPRPSPDGKWLLLRPFGTGPFTAVETTTHRAVHWKAATNASSYVLWLVDSRRWVEFSRPASNGFVQGATTQPIIHSIDGPDRKTAAIPDILNWPIGVGLSTHVLDARNGLQMELWEYDLDAASPKPVKHPVPFASGVNIQEVEGSPDGKWVAYLVTESQTSFFARVFGKYLPLFAQKSDPTVSLWVSRTDGSELRRLGFETAKEAAGVQWSPDGKRLGLFLNDGFYLVPIH